MNESSDATMENSKNMTNRNSNDTLISNVAASVTLSLHPLVIMNVSEHYTRIKAQGSALHIYGALLGKQDGRHLELCNSFELKYSTDNGIDMEYFRNKEEQFRQVFTDLDFLGWYTVDSSTTPNENDIKIHKSLLTVNESSLMMKLNPISKSANLPVTIYESMMDIVDEQPRMMFIQIAYTLVTEEAERIGVDHIGRLTNVGSSDTSKVAEYMQVQRSAVKMLHSRINIILQYVKAVKDGQIVINQDIMRDCLSLCQSLPVMKTDNFQNDFVDQYSDVLLMSYLSSITKGCNLANELIGKLNLTYDRMGAGRRPRGMLF